MKGAPTGRPPGERIWRNEGELAPILKSTMNMEKLFAMDPEYLEPMKAIMESDYFRARFLSETAFRAAHSRRISPILNYFLSEALLEQTELRAVATLVDIFPHGRAVSEKRNPRPFFKFAKMHTHEWQEGTVEWSPVEVQNFYTYTK